MKRFLAVFFVVFAFAPSIVYGQDTVALYPEPCYTNITELNYGAGLGGTSLPYSKYFYGITNVSAYQITKSFLIGIGIGVLGYNSGLMIPFYLDFRYNINYTLAISKFVLNPYVFGDGGFLFSTKDFDRQTRMFANPGIGARLAISENLAANLGIGMQSNMGNNVPRDCFVNFKAGVIYLLKK
jgi:hypothetical protein